jgi:hypothetical protein
MGKNFFRTQLAHFKQSFQAKKTHRAIVINQETGPGRASFHVMAMHAAAAAARAFDANQVMESDHPPT